MSIRYRNQIIGGSEKFIQVTKAQYDTLVANEQLIPGAIYNITDDTMEDTIPIATTSSVGGVKPDGTTIAVQNDGTISVNATNLGNYNLFAINKGSPELLTIDSDGSIAFNVDSENPLTYTNAQGNTRTVTSLNNIQLSSIVLLDHPALAANGTLGGDSFAVAASSEYSANYAAYHAFNKVYSDFFEPLATNPASTSPYLTMYNPVPICVKKFTVYNYVTTGNSLYAMTAGEVHASNDGTNWTKLVDVTNDVVANNTNWDIDLSSNTGNYKYYKIVCTGSAHPSGYWVVAEVDTYIVGVEAGRVVLPNSGSQPYLITDSVFVRDSEVKNTDFEVGTVNIATAANAIGTLDAVGTLDIAFDGNRAGSISSYTPLYNNGVMGVAYIGQQNLTGAVRQITLCQGGVSGSSFNRNYCVTSVKIQYSIDNTNWIDIQTVNNLSNGPCQQASTYKTDILIDDYTVPSSPYSMRLLANSSSVNGSTSAWIVNEVEFYGRSGNPIWVNPQQPITAKRYNPTNGTWENFDDTVLMDGLVTFNGSTDTLVIKQPIYNNSHILHNESYIKSELLLDNNKKYVDLTLGATGSYIIAPADGYLMLNKTSNSSGQHLQMSVFEGNSSTDRLLIVGDWSSATSQGISVVSPLVRKGTKIYYYYTTGGATNYFRFVYVNNESN